MPSGVHQHGMAAKKGGLRFDYSPSVALLVFILFYWVRVLIWVVEFAPFNFKGSIWAIQMGKLEAEVT